MNQLEAETLLNKLKAGTITIAEKQSLEQWYIKIAAESTLSLKDGELDENLAQVWKTIKPITQIKPKKTFLLWKQITVAASILVVVGLSFYLFQYQKKHTSLKQQSLTENIKPGGNRATLTLDNGEVITLDDAANGKLAEQNGIIITKAKDGHLIYSLTNEVATAVKYHTISTPKGGEYQINLPDGSKVWLNAESSLKYPTFFTGKERKVTLTGEAYFEVAKIKTNTTNKPFIVMAGDQAITVLGTHFNVNTYKDEDSYKTTLLEGSVRVSYLIKDYEKTVTLNPGEQSSIDRRGLTVSQVNAEDAIAWKNGIFLFKDADLKTVMRAVARWYDVDVAYEGTIPNKEFSGEIPRNLNLKQVFEILSFFKVHFRTDGKTITVTK